MNSWPGTQSSIWPVDDWAGSWRWEYLAAMRELVGCLGGDEVPLTPPAYRALVEAMDPQLRYMRVDFHGGENVYFKGRVCYPGAGGYCP